MDLFQPQDIFGPLVPHLAVGRPFGIDKPRLCTNTETKLHNVGLIHAILEL